MPYRLNLSECCKDHRFLSTISDFLPEEDFLILNNHKTCSFYQKGQIVFTEGNSPYGLYFLEKGKVKLCRETITNKEIILRLIKAGEVFGFRSLLTDQEYKASATAIEDCVVCFFHKEDFLKVLNRNFKLARYLLKLVAQELGKMEENMGSLAHKSIRERVAEKLVMLADNYGKPKDEGVIIDLTLSRQDLANLIGTTSEQTTLFLSEFRREGLITFNDEKKIILIHPEKLTALSNYSGLQFVKKTYS